MPKLKIMPEKMRAMVLSKLGPVESNPLKLTHVDRHEITNPNEIIDWTIKHRLEREAKVIKSIERFGVCMLQELLKEVYSDVDPRLHPIAEWSLNAHLERLMELGKVVVDNHEYSLNK